MRMSRTLGLSLALLVASSVAMAKQNPSSDHHTGGEFEGEVSVAGKDAERQQDSRRRGGAAPSAARGPPIAETRCGVRPRYRPPIEYVGPMRVIGQREVGRAAWYGDRHVGRRTASGERLDAVHATAAHRSLPLHSLVRVTNLRNGRSVIARINDRGPVSRSLLIDVSPRAADEST